jgi:hypothetical protein
MRYLFFTILIFLGGCAASLNQSTLQTGTDYSTAEKRIIDMGGKRNDLVMKGIRKNWVTYSYTFGEVTLSVAHDPETKKVVDFWMHPLHRDNEVKYQLDRLIDKTIDLRKIEANIQVDNIPEVQ